MDIEFVSRMEFCAGIVGNATAFARKAGISQSGARKYYHGAEPTRPVLLALSEASGVNLLWLGSGRGPVCDLGSPLMASAKQELVKSLGFARQNTVLGKLVEQEAVTAYCDQYNKGEQPGAVPDFVRVIIPVVSGKELLDWARGKFSTPPKCYRPDKTDEISHYAEDWIQAPSDLVVAVARELPLALGEHYSNLSRQKEAHVLRTVVNFLTQLADSTRNEFLNPALLRPQIHLVAHIYDTDEKV